MTIAPGDGHEQPAVVRRRGRPRVFFTRENHRKRKTGFVNRK